MARRGSTRAPSGRARAPPSQAARSVATRTPTPTRTPTRTPRLRPEPRSEPRVGVVVLGVGLGDLRLTPAGYHASYAEPRRQLVITLPRRLAPAAQGSDLPARRLLRERGQGERRRPAGRGRPPLTWIGLRFRARFERVSRRNPAYPTLAPTRTRSLAGRGRQLRGGGGRGQVGTALVEPGGRPARGRPPRGRRRGVRQSPLPPPVALRLLIIAAGNAVRFATC